MRDYKLDKLKKELESLRMQLSRKSLGSEILAVNKRYLIRIRTTEPTGHFSKKTIAPRCLEINSNFLALEKSEQEKELLKTLEPYL